MHDPDDIAVRQERNAEKRTDPFLQEDRIKDRTVVHAVERDWPSFGSDASGEPLADGDADALIDFLFDTFRRPGNELIPRRIEQQDGCCVGLQDVTHAQEQFIEEIVYGQMRERDIGDELKAPKSLDWIEDLSSTLRHGPILGDVKRPGQRIGGLPARKILLGG
jgi:hypothetical protein